MDFRNPVFSSPDNSTINAEVDHLTLGWIPFTAVNGDESTQEMFDAMLSDAAPYAAPAIRPSQVDAERDRRIAGGVSYGGAVYQSRPADAEKVSRWAGVARAALEAGSAPGDYRWHGQPYDFEWIAADNASHKLDAAAMVALNDAMLAHEQTHVLAARKLKDTIPIPDNYDDDAFWPQHETQRKDA
ncbi:hypothetical protein [Martelella mangrovi]|uniref:DUF4376 domain-containing protein n=1 Tax=Martelella mangrovi TaxID=1397477 RepID=A0ABV2IFX5_9HYPH